MIRPEVPSQSDPRGPRTSYDRESRRMTDGLAGKGVELGLQVVQAFPARGSRRLNIGDRVFRQLTALFALILLGVLASIFVVLTYESSDSIKTFGWSFVFNSTWDPVFKQFGALPFICGTLVSSFLALLQAVPLSIGTAVFLSEMAPGW